MRCRGSTARCAAPELSAGRVAGRHQRSPRRRSGSVQEVLQAWGRRRAVRCRSAPVLLTTVEAFVAAYSAVFSVVDGTIRLRC